MWGGGCVESGMQTARAPGGEGYRQGAGGLWPPAPDMRKDEDAVYGFFPQVRNQGSRS